MKGIAPYLFFNGNCGEAMAFYQKCLGGELNVMMFEAGHCPVGAEGKVMHAMISAGPAVLMASDDPFGKAEAGGSFAVSVNCSTLEEINRMFSALSEGGKVTQPLHDAFWGSKFGMLVDRFGVSWMFSCDTK